MSQRKGSAGGGGERVGGGVSCPTRITGSVVGAALAVVPGDNLHEVGDVAGQAARHDDVVGGHDVLPVDVAVVRGDDG